MIKDIEKDLMQLKKQNFKLIQKLYTVAGNKKIEYRSEPENKVLLFETLTHEQIMIGGFGFYYNADDIKPFRFKVYLSGYNKAAEICEQENIYYELANTQMLNSILIDVVCGHNRFERRTLDISSIFFNSYFDKLVEIGFLLES